MKGEIKQGGYIWQYEAGCTNVAVVQATSNRYLIHRGDFAYIMKADNCDRTAIEAELREVIAARLEALDRKFAEKYPARRKNRCSTQTSN